MINAQQALLISGNVEIDTIVEEMISSSAKEGYTGVIITDLNNPIENNIIEIQGKKINFDKLDNKLKLLGYTTKLKKAWKKFKPSYTYHIQWKRPINHD